MNPESQIEGKNNSQNIDKLLTPSWLSGLIAVTIGLAVTIGVILSYSFNNSQIQQQLANLQNTPSPALTLPGQTPPSSNNTLQNTWPLLGFWGAIGLVVYFLAETVIKLLRDFAELKRELDYVHARRDIMIKTTAEYLLLRLVAVIIWLIFINVFFKRIIPYSITAAYASASDLRSLSAFLYELLSFSMIVFSMHLHTIFLRLSLRRPRVFSNA